MGRFFRGNKGWDCNQMNEDGSRTCRRFEKGKDGDIGTGTEITIGVDQNCNEVLTGDVNRIMDSDEEAISNIAKKMTASCKRGLS